MNKLNQKIITKLHRWLAFTVGIFIIFQSASGTIAQKRFELMQFSSPSDYRVEQIAPPASPKEIFISIQSIFVIGYGENFCNHFFFAEPS